MSTSTDALLDDMSAERQKIAMSRTFRSLGIAYEWDSDGTLLIVDDAIDLEVLADEDCFLTAFAAELERMLADEILTAAVEGGLLKPDRVDGDGQIVYIEA